MLIETRATAMVETTERGSLAKVAFYCADTLIEEVRDVPLIPLDGLGVGEIEDCILIGHTAIRIADIKTLIDNLLEESVLWSEVWKLP